MLFSNELNYWVIKKKCEKIFTAPDGGAISEPVSKLVVQRKCKNINVKWTNIIQKSPMHFGKK
ncbi:hypothetical protein DQM68_01360 [Leptospira mayottensis]|uniref:Uncharacterized protein n=1 Tax=Leptospira mayottensis TaxID=1137606 RepID=A0ABM6YB73_9LEPT|nr:hypothetical protein DQM68_01360 [Leptospira mayottensis]AXR65692.1 hypothetical protein DQM28_17235 [Leptospira mayottensis]AZQ01120.1 hypothetical protein LEP1GSC190_02620 [Leptospira mayottensis 200901116]